MNITDHAKISFLVSEKYSRLIKDELDSGNFPNKSEFLRYLIIQWFEKNRPEKLTTES